MLHRMHGLSRSCVSKSALSHLSLLASLLAAALFLAGCGNVSGNADPPPMITDLSPTSVQAGSPGFLLEVFGVNFTTSSVVFLNGTALPTQFICSKEVTATVSASAITSTGLLPVKVGNSTTTGTSNQVYLYVSSQNPVPTITSLAPPNTLAGGAAFTLTVNGTNFISSSVVNWNGSPRVTTYVSASVVTAAITAADIATGGTSNVTVVNPAPGGGTSNAVVFTIDNPVPTITSLNPPSATATGPAFTLTVNGTNFDPASVVNWNGSPRATTFVSGTQLTAAITAADIATVGTSNVTVFNPAPAGGTSNVFQFTVNSDVPTLTFITPMSAPTNTPGVTITLTGTGFLPSSVAYAATGTIALATTYVGPSQLTAQIPAANLALFTTTPVVNIEVINPAPGGASNALPFDTRTFADLTSVRGDYILQFSGYDSKGPVVRTGLLESDGNGHITGGVMDTASQSGGVAANQPITAGSYTMNLDGTGQLVVNGVTYQMMLNQFNTDITDPDFAEQLDIIEFDDTTGTGTRGSGTLTNCATAFPTTTPGLAGDYAFGGQGTNTKAQRSGLAGRVTVTANATFTNGLIDLALPGGTPSNISVGITGSFTDPDGTLATFGRYTITMTTVGAGTLNLIGYYNPLDGKTLFMDVDTPGTNAFYFGQMSPQILPPSGGWSNAALTSDDLLALTGVSAGGSNLEIGAITYNGAGGGAGSIDQNNAGTLTLDAAVTPAYNIPAAGFGRATLALTQGATTTNFTLYMIQTDEAYVLEGTPASPTVSFQTGFIGWTSCATCSAASFSTDFGFGTVDPAIPGVPNQVGLLVTDGLTNIETVTQQSSNVSPFLQTGVVSDNTYAVDATGRATVPGPAAPTFVYRVASSGAIGMPTTAATTAGAIQIIGSPPFQLH